MCGIVGFLDATLTAVDDAAAVLARMRAAVRHRGPDDEGQIAEGGVGLGIQRLSIVDLATGRQPMRNEDGQIWLVFNGEIYNHADLRAGHVAAGRRFRTRSDTEVILAQYERFGLRGITDLNGMFAFAIWDARTRQLHLVRDRMGVKPLYYFTDGTRFYFASEIKALIASGRFEPEPNAHAVWDFLTFRYVPAPDTIWRKIFKLPPAHTLSLRFDDLSASPKRYWDMPYVEPAAMAASDCSEEAFAALFRDAVRIRMIADVPVGVFLSGGLDSSAVSAAVDRKAFPELKTFSVTLENAEDGDERAFARLVAGHLGTDHQEVVVTAEQFVDFLGELPIHTDEPLADPTCVPVYFLARQAREQVKVVLSGEGGDEILGGYTFDAVQQAWDRVIAAARGRDDSRSAILGRFGRSRSTSDDYSRLPIDVDQRRVPVPLHITNYLSSDEKRSLFAHGLSFTDSIEVLKRDLVRVRSEHPLHQSLYLYCQNWLVEDLLMKVDKMTMATSLELRTPFLDYRLVEWAARAPASQKVWQAKDGRYVTKKVLREYARRILPRAIVERPKMGFPVPVYSWLSTRLRCFALDNLCNTQPKCSRWLEPVAIRAMAERGTAPDASVLDRHRLWNLLVLELWMRAWLR